MKWVCPSTEGLKIAMEMVERQKEIWYRWAEGEVKAELVVYRSTKKSARVALRQRTAKKTWGGRHQALPGTRTLPTPTDTFYTKGREGGDFTLGHQQSYPSRMKTGRKKTQQKETWTRDIRIDWRIWRRFFHVKRRPLTYVNRCWAVRQNVKWKEPGGPVRIS